MRRAVIFANGDMPEPESVRARLQPDDWLIAADGGARHLRTLGRQPHLIVGDLDSLQNEDLAPEAALQTAPAAKDETDLELALLRAAAEAENIVIVAAGGGRLDMTLANVLLLAHPALSACRVEIWHGPQTAWLIRPPGAAVHGQPGDTLSLIPLGAPALGLTTRGLAYPLSNGQLSLGPGRGLSNVLTAAESAVELRTGLLLAVLTPGRA